MAWVILPSGNDTMGYCAGCGGVIDHTENFPVGYPEDRMLCCGCIAAFQWYLSVSNLIIDGFTNDSGYCRGKWELYGKQIKEAMRIQ